ncbi:MAG: nucleotide sugar dehydrogenase [Azospirillum sp.]|nr:nucleotide sugar dehydrogenase [Azospirillum sp.]
MSLVSQNYPDRSVCVIGLGYVGLTLAVTMANVGFRVIGVEVRPDVVDLLRRGQPHFFEPGLEDALGRCLEDGSLQVVPRIPADCEASVFVITVGTPLGPDHRVRLDMIAHASSEVAAVMRAGALVILRSTVRLGTTREVVKPILDRTGLPYEVAFCPERTLEGVALAELRHLPQIIGADDLDTGARASQLFQFLTPTTVRVRSIESAELIKMIDNAQRDVHFAYANEVARMCDAAGISAAEVISAGKLGYPRTNLPMPGPVGGPCLSKDSHILAEGLARFGVTPEITVAARRLNENQPAEVVQLLRRTVAEIRGFPDRPVIALMGIAFKGRPATNDLRGTMAKPIMDALRQEFPGAVLRGYDPVTPLEEIREFGLEPVASLEAALSGAHLAVIANNHPVFSAMRLDRAVEAMAKPCFVYDFWNNFDARSLRLPGSAGYMALGSHGLRIMPHT